MAGLKAEGACDFQGIGGPLMEAEGLASLFPMDRLSVMGIAEVLPRLPEILRLIRQAADAVVAEKPAALITIDSPDFCLRVAKRARRRLPELRTIHYVAPSVWAWRPGRAAKMARVIDHVLALLPFEPPYMTAAGMTCDFVGHPVVEVPQATEAERFALRSHLGLADAQPLLALLPGSRAGEVARHGPLFREVLERVQSAHPGLACVVPAVPARVAALETLFAGMAQPPLILDPRRHQTPEVLKRAAFAEAPAALAVSGTVSLELAAAGTPMAVAYRVGPLSAAIARRLLRVKYASLVNIIEDAPIIPEFLQEAATAEALTAEVSGLLQDPARRAAQTTRFEQAMTALGRGGLPPGQRAAQSVLAALR
ncbi:MAG: lipid-A-disaccharide synthase [Pseudomonadota bacterium]